MLFTRFLIATYIRGIYDKFYKKKLRPRPNRACRLFVRWYTQISTNSVFFHIIIIISIYCAQNGVRLN